MIVASSTFWIAKLSYAVVAHQNYWIWLTFFITSLFIVYIPSSAARYFLTGSIYDSFKKYINQFDQSFEGKARYRSSNTLKEKYQPFLHSEAWLVLEEVLHFVSDWFSIILNVSFNVIALGFVLNPMFVGAYLATIPLSIISLNYSKKNIEKSSEEAQSSRTQMFQSLLPGWDCILIGNKVNLDNWRTIFRAKHNTAKETNLSSTFLLELTTSVSLVLSLIPIMGTLVWLILTNQGNYSLLTTLVATLPRQITTIQYMSDIVAYSAQWNSVKTRLTGIERSLIAPDNPELYIGNISWGNIFVHNETIAIPITSLEDIKRITENYRPGRITLRGRNGSGKSTLIASLKEHFKEKAFLLPPHSELIFLSTEDKSLSTGEKMTLILDEISNNIKTQLLLLDEWDANLDQQNIENISRKIDEISKKVCVIEIRHRE